MQLRLNRLKQLSAGACSPYSRDSVGGRTAAANPAIKPTCRKNNDWIRASRGKSKAPAAETRLGSITTVTIFRMWPSNCLPIPRVWGIHFRVWFKRNLGRVSCDGRGAGDGDLGIGLLQRDCVIDAGIEAELPLD